MLSIMVDMRALPNYPPRSVRLGGCPIYNAEGLRDQRFRVVQPPRNFGHQPAITAGMRAAYGRAVIVMDAGFQDPPHVILEMAAKLFCNLLRRIAEIDQPIDVGDFRLVDRKVLDAFLQMRESNRNIRGLFSWIIGLSAAPLRLAPAAGLLLTTASVGYGLAAIALKLAGLPFQLAMLGMVGQYVAPIYGEAGGRPLYLEREARGFTALGECNGWGMWPTAQDQTHAPTAQVPLGPAK